MNFGSLLFDHPNNYGNQVKIIETLEDKFQKTGTPPLINYWQNCANGVR